MENNKQSFKCPVCNGSIKRILQTTGDKVVLQYNGAPKCVKCGREYIIKIYDNLLYEVEEVI